MRQDLSQDLFLETLLKQTERLFLESGMDFPKMEAWWLFRELLPSWNGIVQKGVELSPEMREKIFSAVQRRLSCEPLAYISGKKGFWEAEFKVNSSTLIPRPDSEALITLFLRYVPDKTISGHLLDLGTGTGCLLLSLLAEYPNLSGVGADLIPEAVLLAQENAQRLGLSERSFFCVSDWTKNVAGVYEFIISNPPYIAHEEIETLMPEVLKFEPLSALDGGKNGLECYKVILEEAKKKLCPNGKIFLEIGAGQLEAVCALAEAQNFSFLGKECDLAGKERAVAFSL